MTDNRYGHSARADIATFVPASARRLLDVGCNTGGFGEALKQARPIDVWGVEPDPQSAAQAARSLDSVCNQPFDENCPIPERAFDVVTFNDVLEHLVDPWSALRLARTKLRPQGCVVASVPNFLHKKTCSISWSTAISATRTPASATAPTCASSRNRARAACSRNAGTPSCAARASTRAGGRRGSSPEWRTGHSLDISRKRSTSSTSTWPSPPVAHRRRLERATLVSLKLAYWSAASARRRVGRLHLHHTVFDPALIARMLEFDGLGLVLQTSSTLDHIAAARKP